MKPDSKLKNAPTAAVRPLAVGLLALASAATLFGQTPPAPTPPPAPPAGTPETPVVLEELIVTGTFVAALAASAEFKRTSVNIVESVSALDIGKLPDISIAESIARLPGLAAQRVAGRAQVISVRGLAPDFASTLLNGREQVSTGDNRSVEFDQYPSELIHSVDVYKTPNALLVGQGLSGTINLRTVDPLAYTKSVIVVGARYETNTLDDLGSDATSHGYRFNISYIDQFADNTVGLALGYAHLDSPVLAQEFGTYGWSQGGRPGVPSGTWNTDGLKMFTRVGENKRDGVIAILSFRPSKTFTSVIDGYYSRFSRTETARGIETHIGGWNGGHSPGLNYTNPIIVNGALLGGAASGVYPLVRNIYNQATNKLTALGWNNQLRFDEWTFTGDISYSRAKRDGEDLETQAQFRSAANLPVLDTVTYDMRDTFPTARFGLSYNDINRIQVGPSIYGGGYGKRPSTDDRIMSFKLAGSYAMFTFVDSVDFGVNYANRRKDKAQPEAGLSTRGGTWQTISPGTRLDDALLGFISGAPNTLSWSVPAVMAANYEPFRPSSTAFSYLIPKTWQVTEKITTPFVQANLKQSLGGGVELRGNIGLQLKAVDQSSKSHYWDSTRPAGQNVRLNDVGTTYTDVLPSMNLTFDFGDDLLLRVAAAKQQARPRLDQLKSAFEFGVDSSSRLPSGSGGNPKLDPWKATAFDVSFEKYFADYRGYIAIAGYHKKLDTYIYDQNNPNFDFTPYLVGLPITPIRNTGNFFQPLNGRGGTLKGIELAASVPLHVLSDALEGFGFIASYSYNDSEITVDNTNLGDTITLPGLSKNVFNFTAYFEKWGFTSRVSMRKRSDFVGEITGFGADRTLRFVKGENVIDAQIGYEFQSGPVKGLNLILQAYNLNNSGYTTYRQVKERVEEYQRYGRTILIGANYRF